MKPKVPNDFEVCLFQLAYRNGSALYQAISLLHPGWYSESFVSSTFMRHKLTLFADALARTEPIKVSDLYRAALKGALSNCNRYPQTHHSLPPQIRSICEYPAESCWRSSARTNG